MVIAEHPPGRGPNISLLLGYVSETFHLFTHHHPQFVSIAKYSYGSIIKSPRAKVSELRERKRDDYFNTSVGFTV